MSNIFLNVYMVSAVVLAFLTIVGNMLTEKVTTKKTIILAVFVVTPIVNTFMLAFSIYSAARIINARNKAQ